MIENSFHASASPMIALSRFLPCLAALCLFSKGQLLAAPFPSDDLNITEAYLPFAEDLAEAAAPMVATGLMSPLPSFASKKVKVTLVLPKAIKEGTSAKGYFLLSKPLKKAASFGLLANPPRSLVVPNPVTIPAGTTKVFFNFSARDDNQINLTRSAFMRFSIPWEDQILGLVPVTILDDEKPPKLKVTLPTQLEEGGKTGVVIVELDKIPAVPYTLRFKASPEGEVILQKEQEVRGKKRRFEFPIRAVDDSKLDGNIPVTVTVDADGIQPAKAATMTVDNEKGELALVLPATVPEGGTATGTVKLLAGFPKLLTVNLTTESADLQVPATVTIPAGQSQADFTLSGIDNAATDGSRSAQVSVGAVGFTGASGRVSVRDNEVVSYRISGAGDLVNLTDPPLLEIKAVDVEGNDIVNFTGSVQPSLLLPDGTSREVPPGSLTLEGENGWTGKPALPSVGIANLRLEVSDADGKTGSTGPFGVMRTMDLKAGKLVWDSPRQRVLACVSNLTGETWPDHLVAINPETQEITAAAQISPNAKEMAMTEGGEYLYVAFSTGMICKINPATLQVLSTFQAGSNSSGTLHAGDLCTVAGNPELLVVSRQTSLETHDSVAVFDGGVELPNTARGFHARIEPSADPGIFLTLDTADDGQRLGRIRIDENGAADIKARSGVLPGNDFRSFGDRAFSSRGWAADGFQVTQTGQFATDLTGHGDPLVCTDPGSGRVFLLMQGSGNPLQSPGISTYDPLSLERIHRVSLPSDETDAADLIRWGESGLAYRKADSVVFINSSPLLANDPGTDLIVETDSTTTTPEAGTAFDYTILITNAGSETAKKVAVSAVLSATQKILTATSPDGSVKVTGRIATLAIGELEAGASVAINVSAVAELAGPATCEAAVRSDAIETSPVDNLSMRRVTTKFKTGNETMGMLPVDANNLLYDVTRGKLWVSALSTAEGPEGAHIAMIDPLTGAKSMVIPLDGEPIASTMAKSVSNRYFYVGIKGETWINRIDLQPNPPLVTRIPPPGDAGGFANEVCQIQVLAGDGTSIIVARQGLDSLLVLDGGVRRPGTGLTEISANLEPTSDPDTFVSYDSPGGTQKLSKRRITGEGFVTDSAVAGLINGEGVAIHGQGDLVLSSSGRLVNSKTMALVKDLGIAGRPCVDATAGRVYLLGGNTLSGFLAANGNTTGNLTLPVEATGDWGRRLVRWGVDGFGIAGSDGRLYVVRSASLASGTALLAARAIMAGSNPGDADGDGLADSLESFFGTSPAEITPNPVKLVSGGGKTVRLRYPRREGATEKCIYETSTDLVKWMPADEVTETAEPQGMAMEMVTATLAVPESGSVFVRMRLKDP